MGLIWQLGAEFPAEGSELGAGYAVAAHDIEAVFLALRTATQLELGNGTQQGGDEATEWTVEVDVRIGDAEGDAIGHEAIDGGVHIHGIAEGAVQLEDKQGGDAIGFHVGDGLAGFLALEEWLGAGDAGIDEGFHHGLAVGLGEAAGLE